MNSNDRGFPKAIFSCSREEFYGQDNNHLPLNLTIKDREGNLTSLPENLKGHLFIISPVGTFDSRKVNCNDNGDNVVYAAHDNEGIAPLFNGDGMIYRIDFNQTPLIDHSQTEENSTPGQMQNIQGEARLTTRIVKPPAYYADKITHEDESYEKKGFWNLRLARFSLSLGIGNQLNTALMPFQFPQDKHERLIATNDASRPYEIDPYNLKTIAPIGSNSDWEGLVDLFPFRPLVTSAHPCFDPEKGEMYTVEVKKSFTNLFNFDFSWENDHSNPLIELFDKGIELSLKGIEKVIKIIEFLPKNLPFLPKNSSFVKILRWIDNNQKTIKTWKVVRENTDKPIEIKQSVHMMGLTENYLILADTSFKLTLAQILLRTLWINPKFWSFLGGKDSLKVITKKLEIFINNFSAPQLPNTYLYLIKRKQLTEEKDKVQAKKIKIEGEFVHYLTEYDDNNGTQILIHPGMAYSSDAAEFIYQTDKSVFDNSIQGELAGMVTIGMDINSPAVIAINAITGEVKPKIELSLDDAIKYTPFLGLYAFRDDRPTKNFEDIYWMGGGAWKDMLTERIFDMYDDHDIKRSLARLSTSRNPRRLPADEIKKMIQEEIPITISRLHIDRNRLLQHLNQNQNPTQQILTIKDRFPCEEKDRDKYKDYLVTSPQFIPRAGEDGTTDGYISCVVIHSNQPLSDSGDADWSTNSEIWIFDANNLKQGPLYRLSHPRLNFGFTLHTTWMKEIFPGWDNEYDVKQDYNDLVKKTKLEKLFDLIYQQYNTKK